MCTGSQSREQCNRVRISWRGSEFGRVRGLFNPFSGLISLGPSPWDGVDPQVKGQKRFMGIFAYVMESSNGGNMDYLWKSSVVELK